MDEHRSARSPISSEPTKDTALISDTSDQESRSAIIRDGFSMPAEDHRLIGEIKSVCLQRGIVATKSGILRAALKALSQLSLVELVTLMESLSPIKTGRPPIEK